MSGYKIIYKGGCGEIEEKKSRFIATIYPVSSEEEALKYLADTKKQYWDARHNCYAFTIGEKNDLMRCSDDGEPAGTAGRPMLEVLTASEIHNCLAIVTRYFGGVLLGTGGLVRAYQGAVKAGLENSVITERIHGRRLTVTCDYSDIGKIQYITGKEGLIPQDTIYAQDVKTKLIVSDNQIDYLCKAITEGTSGRAILSKGSEADFAVVDRKIILFD